MKTYLYIIILLNIIIANSIAHFENKPSNKDVFARENLELNKMVLNDNITANGGKKDDLNIKETSELNLQDDIKEEKEEKEVKVDKSTLPINIIRGISKVVLNIIKPSLDKFMNRYPPERLSAILKGNITQHFPSLDNNPFIIETIQDIFKLIQHKHVSILDSIATKYYTKYYYYYIFFLDTLVRNIPASYLIPGRIANLDLFERNGLLKEYMKILLDYQAELVDLFIGKLLKASLRRIKEGNIDVYYYLINEMDTLQSEIGLFPKNAYNKIIHADMKGVKGYRSFKS